MLSSHFTQPDSAATQPGGAATQPDAAATQPDAAATQPDAAATQPDAAAVVPPPLIGALLRMPFESVRDRMLAGLHERGFGDLVAAHLDVFQYPGPENQRPSELAKRARISKQALNYLLGELERMGYLERRQDAEDQRVKRVHLTKRGVAAVTAIREIVLEVEADWERQLGARRFAHLRDLLEHLNAGAARTD